MTKLTVDKIRRDLDKFAYKHGRMGEEGVTVYYSKEEFATLDTDTLPSEWWWDSCPFTDRMYVASKAEDILDLY